MTLKEGLIQTIIQCQYLTADLLQKDKEDRRMRLQSRNREFYRLGKTIDAEAQLDNPTPEPAPAPACSCGKCWWDGNTWRKKASVEFVWFSNEPLGFALACPVCGDLLRASGETVAMVAVEGLRREFPTDHDDLYSGEFFLSMVEHIGKQPIEGGD